MTKKTLRIYVDTSVFYAALTQKFMQETKPFWEAVFNGTVKIILSDVLVGEIERASQNVRDFYESLPQFSIERIVSTDESNAIAERYIDEKIVGKASFDDCKHVALATIASADVLVSWNMKHLANLDRKRGYNSVNMKLGYPQIEILTPNMVIYDEN